MTDVLMLKWKCVIEQKAGCDFLMMPSSFTKERVMPMSIMEILTLLLVIFAALSYIDNHKKK